MTSVYRRVNFYELCRLCAQNINGNKIYIFDKNGDDQLQVKIKNCLSIEISKLDFLPKVICFDCNNKLETCNAYREECLKSEEMLSSYFNNYRYTEDFKKSGKVYIKDAVTDNTDTDLTYSYKPNMVNTIILSKPLKLGPPKKSHANSQEQNVPPTLKKSKTKKNNHTQNSMASSQIDITIDQSLKQGILPQDIFEETVLSNNNNVTNLSQTSTEEANINDTPQPSSNGLEINNILSSQPSFGIEVLKKAAQQLPRNFLNIVNTNCEVINLTASDVITIEPSNVLIGNNNNKFVKEKDSIVGKLLTTNDEAGGQFAQIDQNTMKIDLMNENQNHSVIFPVSQYQQNNAEQLNLTFSHQSTVNLSSISTAATSTTINCTLPTTFSTIPQCSTPSSINIEDLRSITPPPSTVTIPISSTSLNRCAPSTSGSTPAKKMKKIDSQRTHACHKCSKSFKRRENLYQHLNSHDSLRPYNCIECRKSFVRKEHLIRHSALHSGERNFTCVICKKSFSRRDNLLKHCRIHTRKLIYSCDVCQKVFYLKQKLDNHRSKQGKCYLKPQDQAC